MDSLYFGAPLPGGCETVGDFAVTRNLGSWKWGNLHEFTKNFPITACTKDFWGAIITVSRSVSTVMNGVSDQAFEYGGYG